MRNQLLVLSLLLAPVVLDSQVNRAGGAATASTQGTDPVFSRAVALSNDQRSAEARALVDSVLRAARPATPQYAEALFWKGVLADGEAGAEESFKSLVTDYPLHRRAEESLIRLAQIEMTRGDRVGSQRYLDRIIVEHPYGQYRARASYWRARLFFEVNELDRACAELGTARVRVAANDVELKTEIDYAAARCPAVPTPATARAAGSGAGAGATGATTTGRAAGATTTGRAAGASTGRAAGAATADRGAGSATRGRGSAAAPPPRGAFTVQAAAFPLKANADAFLEVLKSRGYDARVFSSESMHRVRVGFFATREEATVIVNELKAKNISGGAYVVPTEPR
jgi:cell division septation protein DedD